MIRIWQAFSCNNSSAYRLVARFGDPLVAAEVANEIAGLLRVHGETDPPLLFAAGTVVVVQDDFARGFDDLARHFAARGATVETTDGSESKPVPVSVLFAWPGTALAAAWDELTQRSADQRWFVPPWGGTKQWGRLVLFRDPDAAGLCCELGEPQLLDGLKRWLAQYGVAAPSITLCEDRDRERFAQIAKARCTACGGPLRYRDPRIHDIEEPQFLCPPCGGLYDLATFVESVK